MRLLVGKTNNCGKTSAHSRGFKADAREKPGDYEVGYTRCFAAVLQWDKFPDFCISGQAAFQSSFASTR